MVVEPRQPGFVGCESSRKTGEAMNEDYGYNHGGWGHTSSSGTFTGYGYANTGFGWQPAYNPWR